MGEAADSTDGSRHTAPPRSSSESARDRDHRAPGADTSALKKRKITKPDGTIDWVVLRPEFRQQLADLTLGVIDGVIFYAPDRLVRQPRDLEDLIDIVEYAQRPVTGVTGGRMNLINDNDRRMARMMCVTALKSSEDTARRVARQHLSAAQDGEIQGQKAGIKPSEAGVAPVVRYFLSGILRCAKCHRGLVGHRSVQRRTGDITRRIHGTAPPPGSRSRGPVVSCRSRGRSGRVS
ncbi:MULTISPECIES: recombinase family protein [Streptomyces]|uniref:Recombinase family protein n=1 Tax=Streptomyces ramulosus TaxID=47762 RepID=A0ABW1FC44_9ACTN